MGGTTYKNESESDNAHRGNASRDTPLLIAVLSIFFTLKNQFAVATGYRKCVMKRITINWPNNLNQAHLARGTDILRFE